MGVSRLVSGKSSVISFIIFSSASVVNSLPIRSEGVGLQKHHCIQNIAYMAHTLVRQMKKNVLANVHRVGADVVSKLNKQHF